MASSMRSLAIHPILAGVGDGTGLLFQSGCSARLDLLNVITLTTGVVVNTYRPQMGA